MKPYIISKSAYEPNVDRDGVDASFLKKAFSIFKDLYSNFLTSAYIMEKCTYLTSAAGREHYFQYGEVEYIIYGIDNQFGGIVANVSAIWMSRFIIDSLDYFRTSVIPTPIIRTCYALARGGIQSALDMVDLLITDKGCKIIPTMKEVKIGKNKTNLFYVSYDQMCFVYLLMSDLFLGDSVENRLKDTMQATIQYQDGLKGSAATGADLTKMYTKLTADVKVGVDLVFLPLLGFGIVENDYFDNGNCYIPKTIIAGY